jgi:hypothetical protein
MACPVLPLFNERCNYNAMIEFVTIWKLKLELRVKLHKAARVREKYLKSGIGKEYLKSLVP